jgi:hypothetical protein
VATGQLKLANAGSALLTTIQAGAAAAARTYTWPTDFGAAGTVLTDAAGDGTLSWGAGGGGVTNPLTLTRLLTITQGTANEGILASTGYSLTGANAQNMINLAGTWNTSGNPVALKLAITATAFGATSKLMQLLAGSAGTTEMFRVDQDGKTFIAAQVAAFSQGLTISGTQNNTTIAATGASNALILSGVTYTQLNFGTTNYIAFSSVDYKISGDTTTPGIYFPRVNVAAGNTPSSGYYAIPNFAAHSDDKVAAGLKMTAQSAWASATVNLVGGAIVLTAGDGASGSAGAASGGAVSLVSGTPFGTGVAGTITLNPANSVAVTVKNATSSGVRFNGYGAGALSTDASGNITATSDERLKHVTGHFKAGLAELMRIDPIVFKWREDSGMETAHEYVGFGAHNVRESMPEAVGQTPDGYLTLSDRALLAACVNAIKDLSERLH